MTEQQRGTETLPSRDFVRDLTLRADDYQIRQDGGGRIVQAYITPFESPEEQRDQDGHYEETIGRTAFAKTLAERGLGFQVLFNHGRTFDGRTDGNLMMPIGVPRLVEAHERGLYSETEYLENPLADAALDAIKKGALKGYSFTGRFIKSARTRSSKVGGLPQIYRSEVAMREYGPVLFPAYEAAQIVGTRMVDLISQFDPDDVDRLRELLGVALATPSGAGPSGDDPALRQSIRMSHSIRLARLKKGI